MTVYKMRQCCFTVNNPERVEIAWPEEVRYAIWQLECGQDGVNHHLQGYVEFTRPMSFTGIKRILGRTAHVEARRGTRDQAREYCRKEVTRITGPWEYGVWISGPGHRSDLDIMLEALNEGKTEREILEEYPRVWARNYRLIDRYRMVVGSERDFKSEFHVNIGDSGTGKTRMVSELAPDGYWKRPGPWYDGYDGQRDLILDEIDKQGITLGDLLMITSHYPMILPVKGGHVGCSPRRVYATSNLCMEQWYEKIKPEELRALKRRIDTMTTYRWIDEERCRMIKVTKEKMEDGRVTSRMIEYVMIDEEEQDYDGEFLPKRQRRGSI